METASKRQNAFDRFIDYSYPIKNGHSPISLSPSLLESNIRVSLCLLQVDWKNYLGKNVELLERGGG